MTCAFCQATEDLEQCQFALWDFVPSTYAKLNPGDKVHRIKELITRPAATVVAIEGAPINLESWVDSRYLRAALVTVVLRKATGQEITREVYGRSPVRVLRDRNCDEPACWRHRCERGPGATFCANHWTSLEYAG